MSDKVLTPEQARETLPDSLYPAGISRAALELQERLNELAEIQQAIEVLRK